jgi:hypothetical protein
METNSVVMPKEPPKELKEKEAFDIVLFDMCRNDDYSGIYREFIKRYANS